MPTIGDWERAADGAPLYSLPLHDQGFSWRTGALSLGDGGTLLYSPTPKLGDAAHAALLPLGGPPAILLAPNQFHHLGLPEYLDRYPGARAVASERARKRIARKSRREIGSIDSIRERLPTGASVLEPPGLKNGEVWLRVEAPAGVIWMVGDAFFSLPRNGPGALGFFLRATGTTPGLRIGSTFLWFGVREKKAYREWLLAQIAEDTPRTLVTSHGEIVRDADLPDRLRELGETRLG
jgi:hypothetical protein